MALASNKLAVIHVAKARLGLDDDSYRLLLARVAGVTSSRDLDGPGFDAVMRELQAAGFTSDFTRENLGRRAGMASPGQIAKIRSLWSDYTDGAGTEASLDKWLERIFKVSSLRFVTADTAPKVIGALVRMNERKQAAEGARSRDA